MEETSNLSLPYILPSQAQKHVTHNEALRRLDALVQLGVVTRGLGSPPASPMEGDRYIVKAPAGGAWTGHGAEIAAWQDGAWTFLPPHAGWVAVILDERAVCFWDGSDWQAIEGSLGEILDGVSIQNAPFAGVGTEADATNRFAAKLNNALWTARSAAEGGTGDLRYVMNKESAARTLSLLFQSGYSGRAELGLTGSDDFSLKVSADGATWREAIAVSRATGTVRLPASNILTDYCLNLYTDSGRFAGTGVSAVPVGSFVMPAYLTRYNSTTVSGLGKYLTNNTDYGGTAGTLHASVRALVDLIRDSSYRRYGVEFWVAEFTHGSGTATSTSYLSQTYYLSLMTNQTLRAPNMTFHAYVRAIDNEIVLRCDPGQTVIVNGMPSQGNVAIQPDAGWVSVTVQDSTPLRQADGYRPMILSLYAKTAGNRYQIACPALMGGITTVDDNVGVVAAINSWPS